MIIVTASNLYEFVSATGRLKRSLTPEQKLAVFKYRAGIVHGNTYDYSLAKYTGGHDKIVIKCREHGEFLQTPVAHLSGRGCKFCSGRKKHQNDYTEQVTKVHNNRYTYHNLEYTDNHSKVCITCPIHGDFYQYADNHLKGSGCPKCAGCGSGHTKTTGHFIKEAKIVHGELFDYSTVKYTDATTKISIICKKHGRFLQSPNNHLSGNGCPSCVGQASDALYFYNLIGTNTYKVGITTWAKGSARINQVANIHGSSANILFYKQTGHMEARRLESVVKDWWGEYLTTEFTGPGTTEMFDLPKEEVDELLLFLEEETNGNNYT